MIKIKDLVKVYRTEEVETTAINKLNIEIKEGEFVSIMGPSGCGKSTLLNILGLIDNPSSGEYWFLEEEVAKYPERKRSNLRKHNIGFIFQSFNLIDELTVFENVELPMLYTKVPSAERKKRVEELLERAVVNRPKLILADEPTGNLDSSNGDDVMKTLAQLNAEGATIIMVTHSPYCAEFGNRVIRLLDGQVVTENIAQQYI